mgnify:CR=1 FL=1
MTPKQHLLLLLTLLMIPSGLSAQWNFQNPLPTAHNLYDSCYINEQESFAVGASGTIISRNTTVNPDWELLPCPVQEDLKKIAMETDGMAFIAGNNGTVLRSADYGESWTTLNTGISTNLNDIAFIPPNRIWAIGSEGMVIHSEDSGENWAVQELEFDYGLNSIFMHNAEEGWICGNHFSLYHTTDAGQNWDLVEHDKAGSNEKWEYNFYTRICFTDSMNGWCCGYTNINEPFSKIIKTTDGGNTWTACYQSEEILTDIHFFDDACGLMSKDGDLYSSQDGGSHWDMLYENLGSNGIFFLNDSLGGSVGNTGKTMESWDGGQSWSGNSHSITYNDLNSCSFVNEYKGWICGPEGAIFFTEDGGDTWIQQESNVDVYLKEILFTDEMHGWALGSKHLIRTTDGGQNWEILLTQTKYDSDIHFVDSLNGWMVGDGPSVKHTDDGGISWNGQATGFHTWDEMYAVCFSDELHGCAAGSRGMLWTVNGGDTWTESNTFLHQGKEFYLLDNRQGWLVYRASNASLIYKTEDGGENWTRLSTFFDHYFTSIYFIDRLRGFVSNDGYNGGIFYTEDGGITWEDIPATNDLRFHCLDFGDEENGWAVGRNAVIMHTDNGGIVGIDNQELPEEVDVELIVYPNPADDLIHCKLNFEKSSQVNMALFNAQGTLIWQIPVKECGGDEDIPVNTAKLKSGIYFLRLQTNNKSITRKILKL